MEVEAQKGVSAQKQVDVTAQRRAAEAGSQMRAGTWDAVA